MKSGISKGLARVNNVAADTKFHRRLFNGLLWIAMHLLVHHPDDGKPFVVDHLWLVRKYIEHAIRPDAKIAYFYGRLDELYERYTKTAWPSDISRESETLIGVIVPFLDSVFWESLLPASWYLAARVGVISQVRRPLLLCSKLI